MVKTEEYLSLARKIAWRYFKSIKNKYSYDEIESAAFLGLVKASKKFDENKGVKFLTYASTVVENEIKMSFRDDKWLFIKRGAPNNILSLNYIIDPDNNTEMQDILVEENEIEENIVNLILVERLFKVLDKREKEIIYLYIFKEKPQRDIAKMFNISQSYTSRIIKNSLKKMRNELYNDKFLA